MIELILAFSAGTVLTLASQWGYKKSKKLFKKRPSPVEKPVSLADQYTPVELGDLWSVPEKEDLSVPATPMMFDFNRWKDHPDYGRKIRLVEKWVLSGHQTQHEVCRDIKKVLRKESLYRDAPGFLAKKGRGFTVVPRDQINKATLYNSPGEALSSRGGSDKWNSFHPIKVRIEKDMKVVQ